MKTELALNNTNKVIKKPTIKSFGKKLAKSWELYLLLLPAIVYFVVFHYGPMYGVQLAFKDYIATLGIGGSPWTGLANFQRFFNSYQFKQLLSNTLILSGYQLIVGFPIPIILALLLNQVRGERFKKIVQTVTYAPHFISIVVLVSILNIFLSTKGGVINGFIEALGGEKILFLGKEQYFRDIYVWSGVWQNMGWNAIIYLAALSSVSMDLHEAAIVDGASKFKRILHIDLPSILPTAIILLILNFGQIMSLGFEKSYLMQNSLNIGKAEIISTYVYKIGLLNSQYGFATAVGLFNSIINLILLVTVNKVAKKISDSGLW